MKNGSNAALAVVLPLLTMGACVETRSPDGPGIRVNVSPLTLPGVKDVCYGLYVQNGSGELVTYLSHICSSQYGNSDGGDISYVAPCDAHDSPSGNASNTVTLVLEGIDLDASASTSWLDETQYRNPCGWPDPNVGTQALATVGTQKLPLDTHSPGYSGPGADMNVNWDGFKCQRVVSCEENADVEVVFNLTVMRDADQGFFDIAVNFEDIFCSAKVDCAYPGPNGGPIELVFDPVTGKRVPTVVWAFACTDGDPAGSDSSTATHLYVDDLVLDCGGTQYTIPAAAGPGNIYPIAGPPPTPAPAPLVQAMEFEGRELIRNGDVDADKLYWNVALGLNASFFSGSPIPACKLMTKATASKGPLLGGVTPMNTNYPLVVANVSINSGSTIICSQHPLDGEGSQEGVSTEYSGPKADGSGFATVSFGNEGAPATGGIATSPIVGGPVNPCLPNPCLNGGVCSVNGPSFVCNCLPAGAWTGATCGTDVNGCDLNPCYAGVSCTDAMAPQVGFTCGSCPLGMTGDGENCECDPSQYATVTDCGCTHSVCGNFMDCLNGACVCLSGYALDPTGDCVPPGTIEGHPGESCRAIKTFSQDLEDGAYWIDTSPETPGDAVLVWCDMTYDAGGWTTIANTLRPNVENAVPVDTPVSDMSLAVPTSRNAAIWKWAGEQWGEFMVECRPNAGSVPSRWVFSRSAQVSAVQIGLDQLVTTGNNAPSSMGTSGAHICPTSNAGNVYCGHNNTGAEPTWGDGLQIGNQSPVWSSLLFGATDTQGHFKCNQTIGNPFNSPAGDMTPQAIWTYRIR